MDELDRSLESHVVTLPPREASEAACASQQKPPNEEGVMRPAKAEVFLLSLLRVSPSWEVVWNGAGAR